jgi:hypothetical protein
VGQINTRSPCPWSSARSFYFGAEQALDIFEFQNAFYFGFAHQPRRCANQPPAPRSDDLKFLDRLGNGRLFVRRIESRGPLGKVLCESALSAEISLANARAAWNIEARSAFGGRPENICSF